MLSAAGFKMLPADTQDKLAHAQSLPQLKVKYFTDPDGTLHYWMADAQYCHCVYIGNEAAYQKFKQSSSRRGSPANKIRPHEMQAESRAGRADGIHEPDVRGPDVGVLIDRCASAL